jgi:hypothetical protein
VTSLSLHAQAMHGAHARAAGYTAAEGFVVRFTLQVSPS